MIIVGIDGVCWDLAKEMLSDLFPKQSMRKIKCNVRSFTNTPLGGQPTVVGLACMWSGELIKNFDENIFCRLNPVDKTQAEDNYPIRYIRKDGTPMDLVFNYFDRCKIFVTGHGPNPHHGMDEHFKFFSEVPNAKEIPCEEMAVLYEVHKDDWDLFNIHTSVCKSGVTTPGPYEQGRIPSLVPYDEIRKNKPLKELVFRFGIMRYKYMIQCMQEMRPDDIIIVTTDHGALIKPPYTLDQVDDIFVIVNREDIDLSDINFQWDMKKLILRLKELDRK